MNVGHAIKFFRVQADMTQDDLSQAAGLSVSYLSLLERGRRDPSLSKLLDISEALDVPFFLFVFIASDESERAYMPEQVELSLSALALRYGEIE